MTKGDLNNRFTFSFDLDFCDLWWLNSFIWSKNKFHLKPRSLRRKQKWMNVETLIYA